MTTQKLKCYLVVIIFMLHVLDVGGMHIHTMLDVVPYASNLLLLKILPMMRKILKFYNDQ